MKHAIEIKGREYVWHVYVQDNAVDEMRADGIEVLDMHHAVPMWVFNIDLTGLWCATQDTWGWIVGRFKR